MVGVREDVGLDAEHVLRGEAGAVGEEPPNAFVAVGVGPVEGDGEGIGVGGDAGVCGGEETAGRIDGGGKLVEGDGRGPFVGGSVGAGAVGGDGGERRRKQDGAAEGNAADGMVDDVAGVVGGEEVLGGAGVGAGRLHESSSRGGGVEVSEGQGEVVCVVERPAQGDGAGLGGEDGVEERGVDRTVVCREQIKGDSATAANADDFGAVSGGPPLAVGGLELGGGPGGVEVLDIEVLDVCAEVGEAPGDVVVVADDDVGNAGKRDAGDVKGCRRAGAGVGAEVGGVPDAGGGERKVHVVAEERLARSGVGAGDGEVVRAGAAVGAGRSGKPDQSLKIGGRGGWRMESNLRVVEGDLGEGLEGSGEVGGGLGRGVVAPGADGVEVGEELGTLLRRGGGSEARGEGFAVEFLREGVGKVLKQDKGDEDAVACSPRAGIVGENVELERKMTVLSSEGGVNAGAIALKGVELVRWQLSEDAIGGGTEGQGALESIVRNETGAEDLGEFPGGVPAEGVHLEEAVLSCGEALSKKQIVEGAGMKSGDAEGIASDGDGGREAGNHKSAGELRKTLVGDRM